MIKAVLFDLDGVLFDGAPVHFECLNRALELFGYKPITAEEHHTEFDGLPTREKLRRLVKARRVREKAVAEIAAEKQRLTHEAIRDTPFDPTIYCLVEGLKRWGFKVGVVTNAVAQTATVVLTRLCLEVNCLVTNNDCTPKPDPAPYELAARQLMIRTNQCLAVEDNEYGVRSAADAGCHVYRVKKPSDVNPHEIWPLTQRY